MITTCTQDYTSVSWTTGSNIDGAELHVRRVRWTTDRAIARRHLYIGNRWRDAKSMEFVGLEEATQRLAAGDIGTMIEEFGFMVPMDAHNRKFASLDEARAFALERGYLQPFFTSPDVRVRRVARAREAGHGRV